MDDFWGPEKLNDNCVETNRKKNSGYRFSSNSTLEDA